MKCINVSRVINLYLVRFQKDKRTPLQQTSILFSLKAFFFSPTTLLWPVPRYGASTIYLSNLYYYYYHYYYYYYYISFRVLRMQNLEFVRVTSPELSKITTFQQTSFLKTCWFVCVCVCVFVKAGLFPAAYRRDKILK